MAPLQTADMLVLDEEWRKPTTFYALMPLCLGIKSLPLEQGKIRMPTNRHATARSVPLKLLDFSCVSETGLL